MEFGWEVSLFAAPRSPGWVVLGDRCRFWLEFPILSMKQPDRDAESLTIITIKSTMALNLGRLHKLRKNAILEPLVAAFPAGYSLTLPDSLTLP